MCEPAGTDDRSEHGGGDSFGSRKPLCRASPQWIQESMHRRRLRGVPFRAHLGECLARADDRGPYPGSLELHLHRACESLESPLGGDVGGGTGTRG